MARASPSLNSFNAGELSPLLDGRPDLAKYASGCSVLENFIPSVQGPARYRPGTRYVGDNLNLSYKSWLVRFEFSDEQASIVEFNNNQIGFFTNHGRLESAPGVAYTLASPYTSAGMMNSDGSFALSTVQTGDVIYIAGGGVPPQKLSRLTASTWSIAELVMDDGPFLDLNEDDTITMTISAVTGTIAITSVGDVFTADHVGSLIRIERKDSEDVDPWGPKEPVSVGDYAVSDGKTYKCTDNRGVNSGSVQPTHTRGKAWDNPTNSGNAKEWEYMDAGYGIARITVFNSATSVSATVITDFNFPNQLIGTGSKRWQFGSWGEHEEYPTQVTLWRDRLIWSGVRDVWMSKSGEYEKMAPDDFAEQLTDSGISIRIQSQDNNAIRWMDSTNALLVGTASAEFVITETTDAGPLGPDNVKSVSKSKWGGAGGGSVQAGSSVFFVEKARRRVREVIFDQDSTPYEANDVTVLAEHISQSGILGMAHQQTPESVIWAARTDGLLLGFTYEPTQGVFAWHRHNIGGIVESVQVIPAPAGDRDDLWLSVKRTINGTDVRYIERLEKFLPDTAVVSAAFYVDCGLSYAGAPATVISGLDHLENEQVTILADGAVHPTRIVSGGSITLNGAYASVVVGLGYVGKLRTMRIEAGSSEGTAQGKIKRVGTVVVRLNRSMGGKVGPTFSDLQEIQYRTPVIAMDAPPPLFTGDKTLTWTSGFDTDGYVCVQQGQPTPFDVVALYPQVNTSDR